MNWLLFLCGSNAFCLHSRALSQLLTCLSFLLDERNIGWEKKYNSFFWKMARNSSWSWKACVYVYLTQETPACTITFCQNCGYRYFSSHPTPTHEQDPSNYIKLVNYWSLLREKYSTPEHDFFFFFLLQNSLNFRTLCVWNSKA